MDSKISGDLVYVLGITRNELGASEYYEHLGYLGLNIPEVFPDAFMPLYKGVCQAICQELVASVHGVYRCGLGIHLAMVAMGGNLGMEIDLAAVPTDQADRNDTILFSETPGRFIVTVDPANRASFEEIFRELPCACIGKVSDASGLVIRGLQSRILCDIPVEELKTAWKAPFGKQV